MMRLTGIRGVSALLFLLAGGLLVGSGLYIPAKAALAQILLERAWHETRTGGEPVRPWPWADLTPVAEIEVPRLKRRFIVVEGANGSAMAFAPGHMPVSAAIGAPGTAIIAAHRDTHFEFLGELRAGDAILATTSDGRHERFHVVESRIVRSNASGLDPADGGTSGKRLALVTCYPFHGVLHSKWRYVVLADLTPAGA